jgi:hypothetical protein
MLLYWCPLGTIEGEPRTQCDTGGRTLGRSLDDGLEEHRVGWHGMSGLEHGSNMLMKPDDEAAYK